MQLRVPTLFLVALALTTAAFGQAIPGAPSDAFQVRYAANLNVGDSVINISNAGTQNAGGALTNICANVYAFSPDEQLIACCSCTVTPNALVHSVCGFFAGGISTVPSWELPEPRKVIPSVRI